MIFLRAASVSNGKDPVESFVTDEAVFVFSPGFFEMFLLHFHSLRADEKADDWMTSEARSRAAARCVRVFVCMSPLQMAAH